MSYATLLQQIKDLRHRNRYCSRELLALRREFTGSVEEWNAALLLDWQ